MAFAVCTALVTLAVTATLAFAGGGPPSGCTPPGQQYGGPPGHQNDTPPGHQYGGPPGQQNGPPGQEACPPGQTGRGG